MLADAEMEILSARAIGLAVSRVFERQGGLVGWPEIGRAAEKPGNILREHVQHFAGSVPPRQSFGVSREDWEVAVPGGGEAASLHEVDLVGKVGMLRAVRIEELAPCAP